MISKITHIPLYVKDQDAALTFYTEKLGFKVHTDADYGHLRWLTLCTQDAPDFELILSLATPETEALVGKQAGEHAPFCCMSTKDIEQFITRVKEHSVEVVQDVKEEQWGKSALIKDLYGNTIYITQEN